MDTITITIGRNVGHHPMATERWRRFIADVVAEMDTTYVAGPINGGVYVAENGDTITEESAVVVGLVVSAEAIRPRLAEIAATYDQEAIGLVAQIGDDTLVMATTND